MKKKISAVILLLIVLFFVFLSFYNQTVTKDFFAMDTVISLNIKGLDAKMCAEKIEEEILRIHEELSVNGNGALAYYNKGGYPGGEVSYLLSESDRIRRETGGAFDAGIYSVTKLWGFTTGEFNVPSDAEVKEALSLKGMKFDFGAIAKGYGAESVKEIIENHNVKEAVISLGGTVLVLGEKDKRVAIASPDSDGYAAYIDATNCVISTSGGYERYFSENGETYSHIMNPETGYPAKSGIVSATVIMEDGMRSDAYSTAVFVMGADRARDFWIENSFGLVIITDDNRMIISEDMEEKISGIDEKYELEIWHHE